MKVLGRILLTSIVVFAILFSVAYLFTVRWGKIIIINTLEDLTRKKVSMDSFRIFSRLNLEIKNLNIDGVGRADYVYITPSLAALITGRVVLNEMDIVNPEIRYEKVEAEDMTDEFSGVAVNRIFGSGSRLRIKNPVAKHITVKNGKLHFLDQTAGKNGIEIIIQNMNFTLSNHYIFPRSVIANFELSGRIPWKEGRNKEGKIEIEGWMNPLKKDIQATLRIEDIDGVYLYPYYSQWINLEEAGVEKARLNFTSDIRGVNNNINAQCHLELIDVVRRPRSPEEYQEKAERIADKVLDAFRSMDEGRIVIGFNIKTRFDRPEFGIANIKTAVEDKLSKAFTRNSGGLKPEDILLFPAKIVEGTVRGASDITKAVIDGTFAVGNELKKAAIGSFKREGKNY